MDDQPGRSNAGHGARNAERAGRGIRRAICNRQSRLIFAKFSDNAATFPISGELRGLAGYRSGATFDVRLPAAGMRHGGSGFTNCRAAILPASCPSGQAEHWVGGGMMPRFRRNRTLISLRMVPAMPDKCGALPRDSNAGVCPFQIRRFECCQEFQHCPTLIEDNVSSCKNDTPGMVASGGGRKDRPHPPRLVWRPAGQAFAGRMGGANRRRHANPPARPSQRRPARARGFHSKIWCA